MNRRLASGWVFVLVLALLLSGCAGVRLPDPPGGGRPDAVAVGEKTQQLHFDQVTVEVPGNVAPLGTKASIEAGTVPEVDAAAVKVVVPTVRVSLSGLQPAVPMRIDVRVPESDLHLSPGERPEDSLLLLAISDDGTKDLIQGRYDPAAETFTAELAHLSVFTLVRIDWGGAVQKARDLVMQSTGIETAKPDCVDKKVTLGEATYDVVSPAQVWSCVTKDDRNRLRMEALPNTPVPLIIYGKPTVPATYEPTGVPTLSDAVAIAFAQALARSEPRKGGAVLMSGLRVVHTLDPVPDKFQQDVRQYPIALYVRLLSTTLQVVLDALGLDLPTELATVDSLACLNKVTDTAHAFEANKNIEGMANFTGAFFGCAGQVMEAIAKESSKGPVAVVLGILSAGPQFFAGMALGAANEITQALGLSDQAYFTIPLGVTKKPTPSVASWVLDTDGIGPIKIGTRYEDLLSAGWIRDPSQLTNPGCTMVETAPRLQNRGINLDGGIGEYPPLAAITLTTPDHPTRSGARVGMTMKELRSIYASQLTVETKNGNGGPFQAAVVRVGSRELVFYFPWGSALVDTDRIQNITARDYSKDMFGGC